MNTRLKAGQVELRMHRAAQYKQMSYILGLYSQVHSSVLRRLGRRLQAEARALC